MKKNKVFIAKSLDGYIAGKNGEIDWLHSTPNPDNNDMGFVKFMDGIDAILMGRLTFELVCSFDVAWPYPRPVFVWSSQLSSIPEKFQDKAILVNGNIQKVLATIHRKGHQQLCIDGGTTIQSFSKEDLIDELIITTIPILLGGGSSLFGDLEKPLNFEHVASQVFLDQLVQDHYRRTRSTIDS